jgi:hypothetical protein
MEIALLKVFGEMSVWGYKHKGVSLCPHSSKDINVFVLEISHF